MGGMAVGAFVVEANNSKSGYWGSYWQGEDGEEGCHSFSGTALVEPELNVLWLSSWKGHGGTNASLAEMSEEISLLPRWTGTRWCLKVDGFDGSSLYDCKNDCVARPDDPEAVEFMIRYEEAERVRKEQLQKMARPEPPAQPEQQTKPTEGHGSLF